MPSESYHAQSQRRIACVCYRSYHIRSLQPTDFCACFGTVETFQCGGRHNPTQTASAQLAMFNLTAAQDKSAVEASHSPMYTVLHVDMAVRRPVSTFTARSRHTCMRCTHEVAGTK